MRKLTSLLIVLVMISTMALAATRIELYVDYSVATVDGKDIPIDADDSSVTPIIRDNRTLLPVRFIAENLGMAVAWEESTRTVTLSGDKTIVLTINNSMAYINNQPYTLDSVPIIHANRTYLPARFISETLDRKVDWYEWEQKVTIRPMPPVYESIEIFNGLRFTPVFPNGLAGSAFSTFEYSDGEMHSNGGVVFGPVNDPDANVLGEPMASFLARAPEDIFPVMFEDAVVKTYKVIGKERFAIVNADLDLGLGFTDNIMYLVYDKDAQLFIFGAVVGTDQAAVDRLNSILEQYK